MANKVKRIKNGMGGSRSGRGRSEKIAIMKEHSKTERRRQQERFAVEQFVDPDSVKPVELDEHSKNETSHLSTA